MAPFSAIIFRCQFIFFRFALFITLVFFVWVQWQICATVMTDKKKYYMLICMVKGRPSLVNFIPYAKPPPATQSSITWQKVCTQFSSAIFMEHSQRCFLHCPCWPCFWHIQKRAIRFGLLFFGLPLTCYYHSHSVHTWHRHAAILLSVSDCRDIHSFIHFSHLLRTRAHTHITLRHTVSCVMKFSNQFA